ncbi:hypothetical protein F2P81_001732 [Scophthalmus maximus]|uniref:Uncharacterized protein n=1 Tax=Scophthalmus maximus TaxID=52904 RepID=A0A6A4TGZ4_SCOMX|nr:hypothetical protein F2P81_001732 [Scophthalmus maximus]
MLCLVRGHKEIIHSSPPVRRFPGCDPSRFRKSGESEVNTFSQSRSSAVNRRGGSTSQHTGQEQNLCVPASLRSRVPHGENVMLQDHVGCHAQRGWRWSLDANKYECTLSLALNDITEKGLQRE